MPLIDCFPGTCTNFFTSWPNEELSLPDNPTLSYWSRICFRNNQPKISFNWILASKSVPPKSMESKQQHNTKKNPRKPENQGKKKPNHHQHLTATLTHEGWKHRWQQGCAICYVPETSQLCLRLCNTHLPPSIVSSSLVFEFWILLYLTTEGLIQRRQRQHWKNFLRAKQWTLALLRTLPLYCTFQPFFPIHHYWI